ncbi:hypothetical protein ILUMI_16659, partial [Ignelater luminosus]
NLDCISSITTVEKPLVSENTTPVGVWCEYAVNSDGFLLPIPGKTETFGVAEIAMEYENNETDLEGTPEMTNKEVEVVEDSSIINVEHESSKNHSEFTGYGDITKLSSTTNNTDSSISAYVKGAFHLILFIPITMDQLPAPDHLLKMLFCNCKKGCGAACECRKSSLLLSIACLLCNGNSCFNTSPIMKIGTALIAESKWKCLQELKNVIAKDHHTFYDNLPFQKDNKTTKGKK